MKKTLLFFIVGLLFVGKLFAEGTLFIDDEAGVHMFIAVPKSLPAGFPYLGKPAHSQFSRVINIPSTSSENGKDFTLGITYVSRYMRNEDNIACSLCENFQTFNVDPTATYVLSFKRVEKKIQMKLLPYKAVTKEPL
jgi:hypothetical protein